MTQHNDQSKHLPKVRSAKQIDASRRNGAKSKGAVTAAGKKKAAMNALKHGLRSQQFLVVGESLEEFEEHRCALEADFPTKTQVGKLAVEQAVILSWQMRRFPKIQAGLMSLQVNDYEDEIEVSLRRERNVRTRRGITDDAQTKLHKQIEWIAVGYFRCVGPDGAFKLLCHYEQNTVKKYYMTINFIKDLQLKGEL